MKRKVTILLSLVLVLCCGMAVAQVSRVDSLLQLLPAAKADTSAVLLYMDLGKQYRKTGNLKTAAEYYLKAQMLSRKLNYMYGLYEASDGYSIVLSRQGLYDSALVVNMEMLKIALQQHNAYQSAIEKYNIGVEYVNKGFNENAILYFQDALSYFEQENLLEDITDLYNQIQSVYVRMDRYEDAIIYGEKSLSLQQDTLSSTYGYTLSNLAVSYYKLNLPQNEKALAYLQKALHIAKLTNDATLEARTYNSIANIHFRTNHLNESETYYQKALTFFKEETYPKGFLIANIGLAKIAMFYNDFAKAEAMAQHNLAIARRHGIRLEEKNNLSFLWELSVAKHDFVGRNRYKAAFDSVQNLVVNETMLRAVEELDVKYETEKKEAQIAELENEKKITFLRSIVGDVVLLLVLATFFFLWRWTVQKKRLAESQKELAEQQIKQFEQEKTLIATQAMFDGEIKERIRLARDLHDRLGGMLSAMKLSLADMKKNIMPDQDSLEVYNNTMELLDESMLEMRRIAHHLMPDALARSGLKVAISEFCKSIPNAKFAWYGENASLDSKLELVVYRIAYELINNAIKHANASRILVQIVCDPDRIALTVQDNGCGFDTKITGEGMGLSNIRAHVASSNGVMDIGSVIGEGTEINVELKIEN